MTDNSHEGFTMESAKNQIDGAQSINKIKLTEIGVSVTRNLH